MSLNTLTGDFTLAEGALVPMDSASPLDAAPPPSVDPICDRVQAVLAGSKPPRGATERRRERRHPFPYAVTITPLDRERLLLREEVFFAIGKHISQGGLDFYYHQPVPHRQAIVTLPCGSSPQRVALLIDLGWCRFGAHRWYENGGKFIQATKLPEEHPDALRLDDLLV